MFFVFNRSLLDIQNQTGIVMQLNENLIRDKEEYIDSKNFPNCRHGVTDICRDAPLDNNPIRVLETGWSEIK